MLSFLPKPICEYMREPGHDFSLRLCSFKFRWSCRAVHISAYNYFQLRTLGRLAWVPSADRRFFPFGSRSKRSRYILGLSLRVISWSTYVSC